MAQSMCTGRLFTCVVELWLGSFAAATSGQPHRFVDEATGTKRSLVRNHCTFIAAQSFHIGCFTLFIHAERD
jgi:hypothetical protein